MGFQEDQQSLPLTLPTEHNLSLVPTPQQQHEMQLHQAQLQAQLQAHQQQLAFPQHQQNLMLHAQRLIGMGGAGNIGLVGPGGRSAID